MGITDGRKPLLAGRGLLPLSDFCRSAGLEPPAVEALIRANQIEGATRLDGRVVGLFQDVLPTAEQLHDLGLIASSDYDPNDLRGFWDEGSDDPDASVDAAETWTMSWPDETV